MVRTGERFGVRTQAVVSDMGQPLGKFVGNALEVYECIKILRNEIEPAAMPTWELSLELSARMLVLSGIAADLDSAKAMCTAKLESGQALERFRLNVECQNGDAAVCDDPEMLLDGGIMKREIIAKSNGFVADIDTLAIGNAICEIGGGRTKAEDEVDPGVGFASELKIGDRIGSGDPIGILFFRNPDQFDSISSKLAGAYSIVQELSHPIQLIREVI
jgi:pyrimidine-nucleoside phosphorylase